MFLLCPLKKYKPFASGKAQSTIKVPLIIHFFSLPRHHSRL